MEYETSKTCMDLHGFTPVRRRDSTINSRLLNREQEKEWTAARCHRLLRALTSRVAILQKDLSRMTQADRGSSRNTTAPPKTSKNLRARSLVQEDDDWRRPRKRIKRTYSTRVGKNGTGIGRGDPKTPRISDSLIGMKSFGPGESLVPTPVLARARGENHIDRQLISNANSGLRELGLGESKRSKQILSTNDGEPSFQLSGTLRAMRSKVNASRFAIYDGIYHGLEALLRSTATNEPEMKRKGTRSLFSMALSAVPSYIAEEEAYIKRTTTRSAINTPDVSTEIYDELEAFGSCGHGWKQLKPIVRSHGIHVLRDAIVAGLLDVEFCGVLVTLCINTFATEEAEILLSSVLSSNRWQAPKTLLDTAPRPFSMLWKLVDYTGHLSYQYHQLTNLISEGSLPLGWLATKEFRPVWTGTIQRLSPESVNLDALMFLEASLPLLAGSGPRSTIIDDSSLATAKHTFSSLLTTLSSIVILSRRLTDLDNQVSAVSRTPYEHLVNLLRSCVMKYRLSRVSNSQGVLLHAAYLIVKGQLGMHVDTKFFLPDLLRQRLHDSVNDLDDSSPDYNDLIAFVCSVARCCGRGASSLGFEYLEYLHLILEKARINSVDDNILQAIIVDSAFTFAQQLPEQTHIDYASTMDKKYSTRNIKNNLGSISEADSDCKPGFRWEEGIGEWVMTTPVANTYNRDNFESPSKISVDYDAPFQSPPFLDRNQETNVASYSKKRGQCLYDLFAELEHADISEDSDPEMHLQHSETETTESDDELHTNFSREEDSPENGDSAFDAEASSVELSFCSAISTKNAYIDISPHIRRRSDLGRKMIQKSHKRQLLDESVASTPSSSSSSQVTETEGGRQFVDRAPRLGRRALRSSEAWKLFDESDDELSFLAESSQEHSMLRDITNVAYTTTTRAVRKTKRAMKQRRQIANCTVSDSEDELCV